MSLTTLPPFLLSGNPIGQSYGSCKQNKGKLHPKSDRPLEKTRYAIYCKSKF